ncbi:hypothetical protein [Aquimarina sp. RZ0]|uniref:hypothetical protein n=1 Tax=Aquimarina sp. RZ0 TaxID=2607730 RepID=UPI0011F0F3D5|nr:hypothetical protein [Aquimarina sp. RZ0]KAA1247153.1 hypothetical protein F0000_04395 [Aquimarina sp. RZ0]
MKNTLIWITYCFLFFSCQQKEVKVTKNSTTIEVTTPSEKQNIDKKLTVAESIAYANGLEFWKKVSEIRFTFNVDRGKDHFERSWKWKPKTKDVTLYSTKDTISYNRSEMDSILIDADQQFINDKFWLLAPYNLVWDTGTKITTKDIATAPISKERLQKLTILYNDKGGYTPGDAYDFYYDTDFRIKEWVFRKSNTPEPSMITTWEDYTDFNGIKIAKTHINKEGSLKVYFTNIKVINE